MDTDRLLHPQKNFLELQDADVETFLRERRFGMENLNLEFKRDFPRKAEGGRIDFREVCAYLVGLSNADGGLLVYGVEDRIKDSAVSFPDYIFGISNGPSLEDLGEWASNFIRPALVAANARAFTVAGKKVWLLRVPEGATPPYCFFDPKDRSLVFTRKSIGGLTRLDPVEVRALYFEAIIAQSRRILEATGSSPDAIRDAGDRRLRSHRAFALTKLQDTENYGYASICSLPTTAIDLPLEQVKDFLEVNGAKFSEPLRLARGVEVFQDGVSAGYFPTAVNKDTKSTSRVTVYQSGLVAFDAQVDFLMDNDKDFNPNWFAYELQRHLQLTKALHAPRGVEAVSVVIDFDKLTGFSMNAGEHALMGNGTSPYQGRHSAITREVGLANIPSHDGGQRNIVAPVIREVLDEVSRIFGLTRTPSGVWDANGYLLYVRGLEHVR